MPKIIVSSTERSGNSIISSPNNFIDTKNVKKINEKNVEYLTPPEKSESDKKDYRAIKLPNGLTALLISDLKSLKGKLKSDENKEACSSNDDSESEDSDDEYDDDKSEDEEVEEDDEEDEIDVGDDEEKPTGKSYLKEEKMAACALCINVGSFSDPIEIQGMAHFLEHMVFMGSEKYPQENDFDVFLHKRGGSDNASTDCEHTTFYFEIQEKHLFPAMDRFAQFFINPLMKRDAIVREREAIESEFKIALLSDFNRKEQLFCSCAKKNHPATKFSWGNLITLRDNIDEEQLYSELRKFKDRHYSAHRMTLAVQARLSLDELEKYVIECFSNVPVNHLPVDNFSKFISKNSFDNPDFRKLYRVKPIKDTSQIELTWVMPPLHHLYRSKPHQYLSWIIGHEGKGSLINYLRKKLWCLDVFSGNSEGDFEHNSMYALFTLTLVLTDDGNKHLKEILEAVYSYINLLRHVEPQKRIFDEIQQIESINFRFIDEKDPTDYVEDLSENMHFYPSIHYLTGDKLYFDFDPESIKQCIEALSPDNVNIMIFDKKFNEDNFDQVEPWFQTKYSKEEIPKEWISRWKEINPFDEFHLPEPNVFITDDFTLIDLANEVPSYPTKIHHNDKTEIWYRADPKFRLPECYIYLYLITPFANESPKSSAMLDIFVSILKYIVVPILYPASAAELNYEIDSSDKGIIIKVYGFNQKLPLLLNTIFKNLAACYKSTTEELFNVMKREQRKRNFNFFIKPNKLCKEVRLSLLTSRYVTPIDKHAALHDLDFNEYLQFAEHLTDNLYIQCLAQGNMTQENLLKCISECTKLLNFGPLHPNKFPTVLVHKIPDGEKYCRVKNFISNDTNSVVTNYYQSNLTSINLSSIIELLMIIMEEPVFNILRTKEQLGYNVFCILRDTYDVLGFSITVCTQANKFTTDTIDERIENFIQYMIETLEKMPDEEYEAFKKSLIDTKKCMDVNLKEEVSRNWSEIIHNKYIFDRFNKEINEISSIKLNELRQWLKDHTIKGKNFKKLSVHIVGTADPSTDDKNTEDVNIYKEKDKYCLEFLTHEHSIKKMSLDSYITDIAAFKKELNFWPILK